MGKNIHTLIHSLTMSEKRYFTKYAQRHIIGQENNYLKLFDFIANQKEYDKKQIIDHFKGEKMVNNFAVAKKYLWDIILKSMTAFHNQSSSSMQFYEWMGQVEILYEKKMYQSAYKLVKKMTFLVLKADRLDFAMLANIWKKRIEEIIDYDKTLDLSIDRHIGIEINNLYEVSKVNYKFGAIIRSVSWQSRSKEDMAKLASYMKAKILTGFSTSNSVMVKHQCLRIHTLYHMYCDNPNKALKYSEQSIKLMDLNPDFRLEFPNAYTSNLINRLIIAHSLKDEKDFEKHIDLFFEFEKVISKRVFNKIPSHSVLHVLSAELEFTVEVFNVNKIKKIITENIFIKRDFKLEDISLALLTQYYFQLASVNFIFERYHEAVDLIQKILQYPKKKIREDIYIGVSVLALFTHYELKNELLLTSTLRSFKENILKRKASKKLERLIFDAISKLLQLNDIERRKYINEIIVRIASKKGGMLMYSGYINFMSWLKSKVNRSTYIEEEKEVL